jgi:Mg2+ transporter MgtE
MGRTPAMGRIPWDDVEFLPGAKLLHGDQSSAATDELPPADLAEIISDLNPVQSSQMVESLDVERLADTLEEVEPEFQASLVESLPDEKIADVLEEMAPDEAADLLAELPEDRSESLLKLMDSEEADDVRKLLSYPEDTAGGMMTTDFVTVPPTLNAEQAIDMLRKTARESETIYYVYVTDDDNHLLGVCSLQSLVLARPDALIGEIMHDRVVSFGLHDNQDDLAHAVAKYNILAVPIVDEENRLQGIVTADDAIDKIIPTAWKKRLPRLYHGT